MSGRPFLIEEEEFARFPWSFDPILDAIFPDTRDRFPDGHSKDNSRQRKTDGFFYQSLSDAILDDQKVPQLQSLSRWRQIAKIPVSTPWDEKRMGSQSDEMDPVDYSFHEKFESTAEKR
jgi:hypothetical protein